jgi:hypothetical protein
MIDVEVVRLRRLRASALQLRALARALDRNKWTPNDALLNQGRCAAWRIARLVSGRLRAHPNIQYQRDAGFWTLLKNSLVAAVTSVTATNRCRAMTRFDACLKAVMRELDDARALTLAPDLSDIFGRSQCELRALAKALQVETEVCGQSVRNPRPVRLGSSVHADSPFLTI